MSFVSQQPGDSCVVAIQAFLLGHSYQKAEKACRKAGWKPESDLSPGGVMTAFLSTSADASRRINPLFGSDFTGGPTLGDGPTVRLLLERKPDFNGIVCVRWGAGGTYSIPVVAGSPHNYDVNGRDMLLQQVEYIYEIDMRPGTTVADA